MQKKKINIRNQILEVARAEFLSKGFYDARIRDVADKSGSSIGNIYVYFDSKDGLFQSVVKPTVDRLEHYLQLLAEYDYFKSGYHWGLQGHQDMIVLTAEFIEVNRKNLELLYFKSQGSTLEGYKEHFINKVTGYFLELINEVRRRFPDEDITVSDFLMHNFVCFKVNVVAEMLMHAVPLKEMTACFEELIIFQHYGFSPLMGDYRFVKQLDEKRFFLNKNEQRSFLKKPLPESCHDNSDSAGWG